MAKRGRTPGVTQLANGKWQAVYCRTVAGPDGKPNRRRRTKVFEREGDAKAWKAKQEAARDTPASADTLGDWLAVWLPAHAAAVQPQTYERNACTIRSHVAPHLSAARLRDLDALAVQRYLGALAAAGVSAASQVRAARTLGLVLNAAVDAGLIGASPLPRVTLPRHKRADPKFLDRDGLRHLTATADRLVWRDPLYLGALVRVGLDAGPRPGELVALKWMDFDPAGPTIFIRRSRDKKTGKLKETKTGRSRRILDVTPQTAAALLNLRGAVAPDPAAPIFPYRGRHLTYKQFRVRVFVPLKLAAEQDINPYSFRHTMATTLILAGVPIHVVSARLGHSSIQTTLSHYAHLIPGVQQLAAAQMGKIFDGG